VGVAESVSVRVAVGVGDGAPISGLFNNIKTPMQ
jgi:hypothetical protein